MTCRRSIGCLRPLAPAPDLLGTASPVKADALAGPVPTLDRVAVRILIEGTIQFAVAPRPAREDNWQSCGRELWLGASAPIIHRLANERWSARVWAFDGMSKAIAATKQRQVLMDLPASRPRRLNNNLALIGGSALPASTRLCVENHGHYDLFLGLSRHFPQEQCRPTQAEAAILRRRRRRILRPRMGWLRQSRGNFGAIDREALKAADLMVMSNALNAFACRRPWLFLRRRIAEQKLREAEIAERDEELGMDPLNPGCSATGFNDAEQKAGLAFRPVQS